ncbi:hypothetical protein [Marinicrinis sediminis]|uniref:Cell wall hydrolase SleB domain-containing protein n=1 Tax=Marinicrinis sediminis TaxID=1652465 RepID=A0ABW5R825_9BACL
MTKFYKYIACILCLTVIVMSNYSISNVIAVNENEVEVVKNSVNGTVTKNNSALIISKFTDGEYESTVTRNKKTGSVTLEIIEINTGEKNKYKVDDFNTATNTGSITEIDTGNKFELKENKEEYTTYFLPILAVIAIPSALAALEAALLATAGAIIIGGITYYTATAVSEALNSSENKDQNYFIALLQDGKFYLGPSITYNQAKSRVQAEADVFVRTQSRALTLTKNISQNYVGPEIHGSINNGYFYHYHPLQKIYQTSGPNAGQFIISRKAHIFYL